MTFKNPLSQNINPSKIATDYKGDLARAVPVIDVAFVSSLLSDVFGVESPVYLPTWWQGRDYSADPYPGITLQSEDPEYDGAPVRYGKKTFGAFWLKGGVYKTWREMDGVMRDKSLPDFLMPLATLVDFTRPKTVTKTPTIGGLGTVKEIYGMTDWDITIKGIIIPDPENPNPAHRTIDGQMDMIQSFHHIAGSINVDGQLFAKRKIYRIVTESLTFSPIQGRPKMMQYSIDAVSDEDLLLTDVI